MHTPHHRLRRPDGRRHADSRRRHRRRRRSGSGVRRQEWTFPDREHHQGQTMNTSTMIRRRLGAVVAFGVAAIWIADPGAQTQKTDWLTDGGDPQRTAWQRNETILTKDNVKDMKLLWKIQLDNQPRQMHNLFPPLIAGSVSTPRGEREVAVVAGVSDNIYAIDVATGTLLWKRKFDSTYQETTGGRGGGVLCPGGLTATPVLEKTAPGK